MASFLLAGTARIASAASHPSSSRRLLASPSSNPLDNLSTLFSRLSFPSTSTLPTSSTTITTTTIRLASTKPPRKKGLTKVERKEIQLKRRLVRERWAALARLKEETQPDPVLGYRPGNTHQKGSNDESLWLNCELKQLILSNEDIWGLTEDARGNLVKVESDAVKGTEEERATSATQGGPLRLNFGFNEEDRTLLFKDLPEVAMKDRMTLTMAHSDSESGINAGEMVADKMNKDLEGIEKQENISADKLARILDLRNASAKGIEAYNKKRIVEHFGGGVDTGSVETQVALLTYRLHRLHAILNTPKFRKDDSGRRAMRKLVHKRAKLLRYLKRQSVERYTKLLKRVGVHRRAVEGQVIVPGRPKLVDLL